MQAIDGSACYFICQSAVLDPSVACTYCMLTYGTKYQYLLAVHALVGPPNPFNTLLPNP